MVFRINIIQIFKRKDTILPFINTVLQFKDNNVLFSETLNDFEQEFKNSNSFTTTQKIPQPLIKFENIENPLIQFKNVSVQYGTKTILNNICWKIKKGDFWQEDEYP